MFKFILFIFLFYAFGFYAQESNCPEPKKKAVKLFNKAKQANREEKKKLLYEATKIDSNFLEAYDELAQLAEHTADNAFFEGDFTKFNQEENIKINYWKKINAICADYRNFFFTMQLADYYFSGRKFEIAKPYYQQILSSPNAYKKDEKHAYNRMQDIETYENLIANPVPFHPKIVKKPSTQYNEYLPMLSPDNRYLFFTRNMPPQGKSSFDGGYQELFIKSRRVGREFSGGIPMGPPFNMGQYQGGVSISVDNKLLFITLVEVIPYRGKNRAGFGQMFDNADIYFSAYKDGSWSKLESIGSHINTSTTWESQPSISADNQTLYFSRVIDPFGGDIDIWKTERQRDGTWGAPINLGSPINTPGDEKSPFMHSDSHTLYFSSNYHIGMGGYDIFYAKMDYTTKKFDNPINIGTPINTEKDEHGFIVSRDGHQAFFSSKTDNKNLDIYSFELYEKARPKSVAFVNGEIKNNLDEVPQDAKVILKNTKTNEEIEAVIDQETGEYVGVVTVNKDEDILLTAKKKGFAFSSQLISSNEVVIGKPIKTEKIEIKPIEVGASYKINDINFTTNSYELTDKILLVLNEFIDFLNENPTVKVAIQGHTDNVGNPNENMLLSENRAKAVYNYLLIEEINPSRLSFKGYGETKPIDDNSTEEGRAKNRRTEFVILEK